MTNKQLERQQSQGGFTARLTEYCRGWHSIHMQELVASDQRPQVGGE